MKAWYNTAHSVVSILKDNLNKLMKSLYVLQGAFHARFQN